jgi:hypothetical protein
MSNSNPTTTPFQISYAQMEDGNQILTQLSSHNSLVHNTRNFAYTNVYLVTDTCNKIKELIQSKPHRIK